MKIFLVVNVDWFFVSHRLPLALEAKRRGWDVTVFAIEEAGDGDLIRSHGLKFVPLPTSRSGTDILQELRVLWFLYQWYRKEKPDIVHHVAVKPVTYGSVAAKICGVPKVVNALSGLGFLFINKDSNKWLNRLVMQVFNYGFKNPNLQFILQNSDDVAMIKKMGVLEEHQINLIRGSGVDLEEFSFSEAPVSEKIRVVLPARMLWDKGVGEFVEAAFLLHEKYGARCEFILAGNVDMGNKAGIPESQLLEWNATGKVKWIGFQKDVAALLKNAHIVVLPSYREGLPKSLIEACAIGRPIVTTDVPGCREVVEDGVNGYLVVVKNTQSLTEGIEKLITDKNKRLAMGRAARKMAEQHFSIENVVERTFGIYLGN